MATVSNAPSDWGEKAAVRRNERQQKTDEPELPESIRYGMHTLPKKFWTVQKEGENLLNDPAYKARRLAKSARHEQNKAEKAEKHRGRKR